MTELTVANVEHGAAGPSFWRLPPVAFFTALVAAPLAVGAVAAIAAIPTAPTAFLGVIIGVSVLLGGPSYLLIFGPMAWIAYLRGLRGALDFAVTGFLANLIAFVVALGLVPLLAADLRDLQDAAGFLLFVHGFGLIFAPIYGAIFGAVFSALIRRGAAPARPVQPKESLL